MYCPQCGSPDVRVEHRNDGKKKPNILQKLQGNSSDKAVAICEDCGYSWELEGYNEDQDFEDIDIQTFTYQDDQEESDQKKTGLHIFDNLKNKKGNDTEEKSQKSSDSENGKQSSRIVLIVSVAVIAICFLILLIMNVAHVGKAQVPDSSSALKGENYQEVKQEFKDAGFTDVRSNSITESIEESLAHEGEIETVSIDGDDSFASGKWFSKDAEVRISYHPELKKAQVPESEADFEGKDYQEVIKEFEESGYTNIQEDPLDDLVDDSTYKEGEVASVSVLGDDSFDSNAIFPIRSDVIITYHAYPTAQVPDAESSLEGENYEDVVKELEEAGFTNVKTEVLDDLIVGWLTQVGEVESVSIDGDDSFDSDASFRVNAEVIVTYHDLPEQDEDEETEESDKSDDNDKNTLNGLNGKALDKAKDEIEKLGYTATYYHANTGMDFTTNFDSMGDLSDWVVTDIKNVDTSKKTLDVYINTFDNIETEKATENMENELEKKLGASYAWGAVEIYGKEVYPAGFSLKIATGMLAEKAEDEDTWFLKAKCTYTNAFGTKMNGECEARVTGTSDNPKVYDFKVY